jgi:signal transduction histidine kinase/ActR/RegA family two-component response regulator
VSYFEATLLKELPSFRLGVRDVSAFCQALERLIKEQNLRADMVTSYLATEEEPDDGSVHPLAIGFDDSSWEVLRTQTQAVHLDPSKLGMPTTDCILIFVAERFALLAVARREHQEIDIKISFDHVLVERTLELFPLEARRDSTLDKISRELSVRATDPSLSTLFLLRILELEHADREVTAEARMFRLAEQSQDLIYRIQLNPKFQILYISPIVETWMGCTRKMLYKDATIAFAHIHPDDGHQLQEMMRSDNASQGVTLVRFLPASGDPYWIEHRWFVDRSTDRSVIVLDGVGRDITRQKREEEAINRALETAEENLRSKSLFLANMSHEIRTPLNAIIGQVELLKDTPLNNDQREMLNSVLSAGQILLSHLTDVLDFSRLDAQRVKLQSQPFSLIVAVSEALGLIKDSARDKGLVLVRQFADDIPASVLGDKNRLVQLLINLLSNAVKFTDSGTIKLDLSCRVTEDLVTTTILISDTGIGFPSEDLDELSRPFSQADPSSTRKREGSGLGLAIVKRLAELMGAEVSVQSESDVGSVFRVECGFVPTQDKRNWLEVLEEKLSPLLEDFPQEVSCSAAFERTATVERMLLRKFNLLSESAETRLQLPGEPSASAEAITVNVPLRPEVFLRLVLRADRCSPPQAPAPFPSELRLLVVEDNEVNRKVLRRQLQKLGLSLVDFAPNGQEALAIYSPGAYDVVLMDIQMPVMDGMQTLKAMKQHHQGPATKFIAVTAHALPGDRETYLEAGFEGYVSKPVRVEELRRVLAEQLGFDEGADFRQSSVS